MTSLTQPQTTSIHDLQIETIQYIGFLTNSVNDYYHLATTSRHNYRILQNKDNHNTRDAFINHFTEHGHSRGDGYGETYEYWKFNGKFHREHDLPAKIEPTTDFYGKAKFIYVWYRHGKLHRDNDLPAVVHSDLQSVIWFFDGEYHRDGGLPCSLWGGENNILRPSEWWIHGLYLLHARNGKLWSYRNIVHNSIENITYQDRHIVTDQLWTTRPTFIIEHLPVVSAQFSLTNQMLNEQKIL